MKGVNKMGLKKVSKIAPIFNKTDYAKLAEEYNDVSEQLKNLKERKEHLATLLKDGAEKFGVKDDKGSFYCDTDDFIFGRVAKKSIKLNEERTTKYLKAHGFSHYIEEVVTYVINKAKVEEAVKCGDIPQKDFESLCDVDTSYSVSVKKKEEMAEIEQTTFKAARKK